MSANTGREEVTVDELDPVSKVKMLPERYFTFIENRLEGGQHVGSLLTADNLRSSSDTPIL